ncbi:MAG: RNA-binding transcriptional accessory protein [Magnetococcales bacterium]|nr:RNA-binding transcriptional accessory protein [Magnetococcales bacterium]
MKSINQRIAEAIEVREQQVKAAVELLDDGATAPFIARYRKEVTGGLTDTHLRQLQELLGRLRELDERRETVLKTIREQEKLTPELERAILGAETRVDLEDLYLPYRPKRRTKATIAREAGLAPLAMALLKDPSAQPETMAKGYVDPAKGVVDLESALEGARHILMEFFSEDSRLLGRLREALWNHGDLHSSPVKGKEEQGAKFSDYFNRAEPMGKMPSHRALALLRGKSEGFLRLNLDLPQDEGLKRDELLYSERMIAGHFKIEDRRRPGDGWMQETLRHTWRKKLRSTLTNDVMKKLTEQAHEEAIRVFARNLHDLLMAAPAGAEPVMGLDPGLRTGVKLAVVDATGKVVETGVIYPHVPRNQWKQALERLAQLARRHGVRLVSIGNGTGSRETEKLVKELSKAHGDLKIQPVMVSEAGASVYSASEIAAEEFPDMDVTLRGAVSIARRLQDPLAELVKIEPKAIGVGQYQHDVDPKRLTQSLGGVVEDAVNAVGVDVNTASAPLLEWVSGLNRTLARNMVAHRDKTGPFKSRKALNKVARFGPKAFEQAAGFLRIRDGENPLDASAVHPEAYPVVTRILNHTGLEMSGLMGHREVLASLKPEAFTDSRFGAPTVQDILTELEKPGRDPRPQFVTAQFRSDVESIGDLEPGMMLEGVVSNVANFGAFVDVGVHQDGLVHISQLADRFVKDPHDVVQAGQVVKVRVLEVDSKRRRIALSMRSDSEVKRGGGSARDAAAPSVGRNANRGQRGGVGQRTGQSSQRAGQSFGRGGGKRSGGSGAKGGRSVPDAGASAMASAFSKAMKSRKK